MYKRGLNFRKNNNNNNWVMYISASKLYSRLKIMFAKHLNPLDWQLHTFFREYFKGGKIQNILLVSHAMIFGYVSCQAVLSCGKRALDHHHRRSRSMRGRDRGSYKREISLGNGRLGSAPKTQQVVSRDITTLLKWQIGFLQLQHLQFAWYPGRYLLSWFHQKSANLW